MPNAGKIERVAELKARLGASEAILLTEYRGLTVSELSELRRSLAEGGASFAVVKNTLMLRAAQESSMNDLEALLEGPTAVAFVEGDAVAAAKKVVDAIKRFPALVLKGGFMDGRMLSATDARALADLESREVMLSKIAGLMKGEMSRAAGMFQSAQSRFVSLMEALREKLPPEPGSEPAAEAEATSEPVAEAETTSEPAAEAETTSEPAAESPSEPAADAEAVPSADAEPEAEPVAAEAAPPAEDAATDAATDVTDDQSTDAAAPAEGEE
jgi:large subunit ribosomal protein L10